MKIEVWSDFVCPFCYIGKRLLEQAINKFSHKDQVKVLFKSYELDPYGESDTSLSVDEVLAEKYNMTMEQVKTMNEQVIQKAVTVGLNYNFDTMVQTNTLDAHRLAKYATKAGKGAELTERILKAHFTESKFIGDKDILTELAVEVGLEQNEVKRVLSGNDYADAVRADEKEAKQLGVQGVPFFVFNRKYAISGAQPLDLFMDTLEKVWREENQSSSFEQIHRREGAICTNEGCQVPER
jgi:predicted DsbA family dithiol-disulfide isomerase